LADVFRFLESRSQTFFEEMCVHIPRISKLIELFACLDEFWPDHVETRRFRFRSSDQVIDDAAIFGKAFEIVWSKDLERLRAGAIHASDSGVTIADLFADTVVQYTRLFLQRTANLFSRSLA
jgi:hypothetical protein